MTQGQYKLIQLLAECPMLSGSWDRKFILNLSKKPIEYNLSDRQKDNIKRLAYKYRHHLKDKGVEIIMEPANGNQQKLSL
jgi:hypothetical protein